MDCITGVSDDQLALWARVRAHDFEPAQPLNFTRRLARDKGWTLGFARGAIGEYRKFCFLAVTCGEAVTPSEEVDEVWHQHLTFSRDYWEVWCGRVLGCALHHDPTAGGDAEWRRYHEQYARTLLMYERVFGAAPEEFWPAAHLRFGAPRFRTLDGWRWRAVPRLRVMWRWWRWN